MNYKCSKCQAENCKLWRQYNTFADHIELLCVNCACKDQKRTLINITERGQVTLEKDSDFDLGPSDQIGWLVPAVPTEDGETFWGYTSVPQDRCEWWYNLPSIYKE